MISSPLLYNKISPNITKPLLALIVFTVGFILYSALIILPYHYGIIVPKKEGIIAFSSFIVLFIIYIFFTYYHDSGFKFPYFIQKYLIDPKLRHDLEDNQQKSINHAYILEIQQHSKSTYALLLQSADLVEPEWFHVNLNLMFPKLYFFAHIELQENCIGQEVNIEYLAESKIILNIVASEIENNFSMVDSTPFFSAVPKQIQQIPSQFLLDFPNFDRIIVERDTHHMQNFNFICKSKKYTHVIPSTTQGFQQLEIALSNKINWTHYNAFKSNPAQIIQDISA